jgi:hypothetical protein
MEEIRGQHGLSLLGSHPYPRRRYSHLHPQPHGGAEESCPKNVYGVYRVQRPEK